MTGAAWLTFAIIGGFIWGGFFTFVVIAFGKERRKSADEP